MRKCVAKDPDARWQTARDLRDELAWIATERTATAANPKTATRPRREYAGWLAAGLVLVAVTGAWVLLPRGSEATDQNVMRLEIAPPKGMALVSLHWLQTVDARVSGDRGRSQSALAPTARCGAGASARGYRGCHDRRTVLVAGQPIARLLDDAWDAEACRPRERPGANAGRRRGSTRRQLGGRRHHHLREGQRQRAQCIPAACGSVTEITEVQRPAQTGHRFPHFLPGSRRFLFYVLGTPESRGIYIGSLDSKQSQRLVDGDSAGVFAAPDWVVFGREGGLWAQRLDLNTLALSGELVAISSQLAVNADLFGDAALSETSPGLIAYRSHPGTRQLLWFHRSGRRLEPAGDPDPGQPAGIRLSPDGRSIVMRRTISGNTDLWVLDIGRGLRRITSDNAREYDAAWSSDSSKLAFSSDRQGVLDFFVGPTALGASATPLLASREHKNTEDWSRDGRYVLYTSQDQAGEDVWAVPLSGTATPFPVATTSFAEARGRFSPDGKWVAYDSTEGGRREVFVQSFPKPDWRRQVSADGGTSAQWREDGKELFYLAPDGRLMAVDITAREAAIDIGRAIPLFAVPPGPSRSRGSASWYAASADGQRFLINTNVEDPSPITFLLGWNRR